MKYGYRKPSIKKSISARTTGRVNRSIHKSINPIYGKKGMGYINNPEKAIYNKIYKNTTKSIFDEDTRNSIIAWIVVLIILIPLVFAFFKVFFLFF